MVPYLTRAPAVAVSGTTHTPARNLKSQVLVISLRCQRSWSPSVVDSMHYVEKIEAWSKRNLTAFVCLVYVVQDTVTAGATLTMGSSRPLLCPIYNFLWSTMKIPEYCVRANPDNIAASRWFTVNLLIFYVFRFKPQPFSSHIGDVIIEPESTIDIDSLNKVKRDGIIGRMA